MKTAIGRLLRIPAVASVLLLLSGTAVAAPEPADVVRYPYVAALSRVSDGRRVYFCAGTLVAPRWILTAAHCFHSQDGARIPDQEIWGVIGRARLERARPEAQVRVERIFVFPDYDPRTQAYDLALVRLDQVAGPLIATIAGPDDDPRQGTALGFGSYFEGSLAGRALSSTGAPAAQLSDRLQHGRLQMVAPWDCDRYASIDFGTTVCATATPTEACIGDSGGPLVIEEAAGTDRLLGVLSTGSGCAVDQPRIAYTRVAPFARWINQTITSD